MLEHCVGKVAELSSTADPPEVKTPLFDESQLDLLVRALERNGQAVIL